MTRAIGADLSRYNISFDPTKATGPINFCFQKATEGYTYVDLEYDNLWQGVQQIPIRGAYCYQRSGLSWIAQADHFLETAARHSYHMHALDLEQYSNTYNDTFFVDARRILEYWREQSNALPILYTNGSTYEEMHLALNRVYGPAGGAWLDSVPLWLSSPATAGAPFMPRYRTKGWDVHQYTFTGLPSRWGTGGTRVDENVFDGTVEEMRAWLGLGSLPPTDPPEQEQPMKYIVVWENGCNTRPEPNVNNQYINTLPKGTEFEVSAWLVPAGKTAAQEEWGKLQTGAWVALTYSSQPRAVPVAVDPPAEPARFVLVSTETTYTIKDNETGEIHTATVTDSPNVEFIKQ